MLDDLIKTWMSLPQIQFLIKNREGAKNQIKATAELENQIEVSEDTSLNNIKWIGQSTRKKLIENGIKTKEDLFNISKEALKKIITSPIALKGITDFLDTNKK